MKASLKNYRQSPRKVRLVADFVKGKDVKQALIELNLLSKRAAGPVKKVIESALANAKHNDGALDEENLKISNITIDKGIVLKRYRPKYGGRATRINKRTSRILVTLAEKGEKKKKVKQVREVKEAVKKEEEKKVVKKASAKKVTEKPVAKKSIKTKK